MDRKNVKVPIIAYPREEELFILDTDACDVGIDLLVKKLGSESFKHAQSIRIPNASDPA